MQRSLVSLLAAAGVATSVHAQIDATYTGPNNDSYNTIGHWDIGVVPINNGTTYNVIVPATRVNYDVPGSQEISSLDLADGGTFHIGDLLALDVLGASVVRGLLRINGFSTLDLLSPLDDLDEAEFRVLNGGRITVSATSYTSVGSGAGEFFSVSDTGTVLDLSSLTTISVDPNTNNFATQMFTINADSGGMVDLSGLQTVNGPVSNTDFDRIEFQCSGAGSLIDLTGVTGLHGPSRFDVRSGGTITVSNVVPDDVRTVIVRDATLTLQGLSTLEGRYLELGGSYTFNAPPQSMIDDAMIRVREGGTYVSPATTYTTIASGQMEGFRCDDPGSLLDLSNLTTLTADPNTNNFAAQFFKVLAHDGGVIDLSGVATINGPVSNIDRDRVEFLADGAGSLVDLTGVNMLLGPSRFFCTDGGTVTFSTVHPDDLREIILRDATLNMTGLTEIEGVYLELGGTYTLNAPPLTDIDDAMIRLRDGAVYVSPATTYTTVATGNMKGFHATDSGTLLDLTNLTTISADPNTNNFAAQYFQIEASDNAVIDLSGVSVIDGPVNNIDRDRVEFVGNVSGVIDATGLTAINGPCRFDVRNGATVSISAIQPADLREIILHDATVNLPGVSNVEDAYVELSGVFALNTLPLADIDGARFRLRDGAIYVSPATSYAAEATATVDGFLAEEASVLDLSAFTTIDIDPNTNLAASQRFRFFADTGSIIDLTGLTTVVGPDDDPDRDSIELRAFEVGSTVDAPNVSSVDGPVTVFCDDGGQVNFGGDMASVRGDMIVRNGGRLNIGGNFLFGGDGETDVVFTDGIINFVGDGSSVQTFEVAGEDVGTPVGTLADNVVMGELIVGNGVDTLTVELCDGQDNGNRGAGPNAEALYVSGIAGGDGLTINAGCTLLLNDLETYVFDSGGWVHINSLFGGNDCISFDGGQICRTGCRADFNQDGLLNTADFLAFLNTFVGGSFDADFDCNNIINTSDFLAYLNAYNAGC